MSKSEQIPRVRKVRRMRGGESGGFIDKIVYEELKTCKEQLRQTPESL